MDPNTDETSNASFAVRLLSRRAAIIGGAAGLGALVLTASPTVLAQDATPTTGAGLEGQYVVMRTRKVAAGKSADELTGIIRAGLVPIIKQIPGFIEYYVVQNANTRERTSVSIFTDKAGADASSAKAAEYLKSNNLAGYYESLTPVVTEGSIVIFADRLT